jgi:hypothetical protein
MKGICIGRIDFIELVPEGFISMKYTKILEFLSEIPIWGNARIVAFKYEGVDIKSCSSAENRIFSLGLDIVEYGCCQIPILYN